MEWQFWLALFLFISSWWFSMTRAKLFLSVHGIALRTFWDLKYKTPVLFLWLMVAVWTFIRSASASLGVGFWMMILALGLYGPWMQIFSNHKPKGKLWEQRVVRYTAVFVVSFLLALWVG
jgi:hypothetical protein